jgi:hypothetical protein
MATELGPAVRQLVGVLLLVFGCASCAAPAATPTRSSPAAGVISCQPYGYTPAPIAFSFPPGPVTASAAEETAVALFHACEASPITGLTSSSSATTGIKVGPNHGQAVWLVRVDATITESSGTSYQSHFLIEVNQATGLPTVTAYG